MKTPLLVLSATLAGVVFAQEQPKQPNREARLARIKAQAAKVEAQAKAAGAQGNGIVQGETIRVETKNVNGVAQTRMFVNGVEVDPKQAQGMVQVVKGAQEIKLGGEGLRLMNEGAAGGGAAMAMPMVLNAIGDEDEGFGPVVIGGDDEDGGFIGGFGIPGRMDPQTMAAMRRNQMKHLKNNPQLPQEARDAILKNSIKMGMPSAVPPPPPDYLPQYQMDDYTKYVAYDKDQDGFLNDEEATAYAEALRADEAAKAAWFRQAMLAEYDQDKDGKLSDAEKKEYQEFTKTVQELNKEIAAKRAEFVKRYDKDGDGKLNGEEYGEAVKQEEMRKLRKQLLSMKPALDTNNDGKFDDAEFAAFEKTMLPKYDLDKDGKLSKKELRKVVGAITTEHFKEMQKQAEAGWKAQQQAQEKRYDIDGDGKLNDAERKRMHDEQNKGIQAPAQEE